MECMFAPLPLATALAVFLPSATLLPVWMSGALLLAANVYMVERRRERGGDGKLHPARAVQLSTFLESLPEAVLIFDLNGKIVDLNHAAEKLALLPRERLKGMTGAEFLRRLAAKEEDGKPLKPARMAMTRALRGEVVRDARRIFHQSGDSTKVEALVSASPMHDSSGKIIGVLQIIRDITQLTELQQRVAVTERHHAVGQMAAGIAHDFSNVLTTVLQAAAMLEMQSQKPAQEWKPYLEIIRKAVRRGNDIISGLREYLRRGSEQTSAVDICRVLEEALELTRPMWQPARDLKMVRQLQAVEPVTANAGELLRVVTNLIINALEAMPEGGTLTVAPNKETAG